ncbi:MAG: hypothetical protein ACXADB_00175 [Candidatus Hermodarchaeia archaeon]|jgi:hypothetical protein
MHLDVMSDNLVKLATEIDNIVDSFVSTAQVQEELSPEDATLAVKQAIISVLKQEEGNALNKWNEMLDKLSDEDYQLATLATRVDLKVTAQLAGGGYKVTIKPEAEYPKDLKKAKPVIERWLQPFFNGVAGKSVLAANAAKKKHKNAQSVSWLHPQYLVFRSE